MPAAAQSGQIAVLDEFQLPVTPLAIALSPDGEKIALTTREEICIYGSNGQQIVCSAKLPNVVFPFRSSQIDANSLTFSPDGKFVAFTENFYLFLDEPDIYLMNTTTGQITNLTPDNTTRVSFGPTLNALAVDQSPLFSPDSQSVYFIRNSYVAGTPQPPILARIPLAGGVATKLAELPLVIGAVTSLNWIPGKEQIVMGITAPNNRYDPNNGIAVINADGMGFKVLYNAYGYTDVVASADGERLLAFNGFAQGQFQSRTTDASSFLHRIDGTLEAPISALKDFGATWATFSPDGQAIAYIIGEAAREKAGLYIAPLKGGEHYRIIEGFVAPASSRGTLFRPLRWAANGVMLLYKNVPDLQPYIVQLGVRT
jgi:dipeptidyl aminopeptidase/acylaminoacyl peptidase